MPLTPPQCASQGTALAGQASGTISSPKWPISSQIGCGLWRGQCLPHLPERHPFARHQPIRVHVDQGKSHGHTQTQHGQHPKGCVAPHVVGLVYLIRLVAHKNSAATFFGYCPQVLLASSEKKKAPLPVYSG